MFGFQAVDEGGSASLVATCEEDMGRKVCCEALYGLEAYAGCSWWVVSRGCGKGGSVM
jgi:hypothetical protein